MEQTTEFFIHIIANNPAIYNKTHRDYKDIEKKKQIWEYIGKECNMSGN